MEAAKKRLEPLLANVLESVERIGLELSELEAELGGLGVQSLMRWVSDACGLSLAAQRVWYRIAKGDLPKEVMETKTPHSILEHMSFETAQRTLEGVHPVIDSVAHRLVQKSWRTMTRRECGDHITPCGHIPPSHERPEERYKTVHATDVALDKAKKHLLVRVSAAQVVVSVPLIRVQQVLA